MTEESRTDNKSGLSIIVPAFNEEAYITHVVESINRSLSRINYEVIVVNNGSNDRTKEFLLNTDAEVIDIPRSTISAARNRGVDAASFNVVAFIDADVRITERWAAEICRTVNEIRGEFVITGARYVIPEIPSMLERCWFEPLSSRGLSYINGGNLIMSKETFCRIGGFDENLETGEDYEFCVRARGKGVRIAINVNFVAIHDGYPKNILDFCKREIWHGKGDFQNFKSFLNSRVSIAAVIFGICHLLLFGSILVGDIFIASIMLATIAAICSAMAVNIFHASGPRITIYNIPICYFYLISRFISLPAVLFGK